MSSTTKVEVMTPKPHHEFGARHAALNADHVNTTSNEAIRQLHSSFL
jgi:hypothetical protein